jgi:3-oxoacyl-[acyl-carrier protein] reductase
VDILVNNAGMFTQALVENLSVEEWDRVFAVNLKWPFSAPDSSCRRCWSGARGASSIWPLSWGRSVEWRSHYAASKAGVIGFTKSPAREVASRGVLVNAIAPGPVLTAMMDGETED